MFINSHSISWAGLLKLCENISYIIIVNVNTQLTIPDSKEGWTQTMTLLTSWLVPVPIPYSSVIGQSYNH